MEDLRVALNKRREDHKSERVRFVEWWKCTRSPEWLQFRLWLRQNLSRGRCESGPKPSQLSRSPPIPLTSDTTAGQDVRSTWNSVLQERLSSSRERRMYDPCDTCSATAYDASFCRRRCDFFIEVYYVSRCELFARFDKLAMFVKTSMRNQLFQTTSTNNNSRAI